MSEATPLVEAYVKTCFRLWVAIAKTHPARQQKRGVPDERLPAIRHMDFEGSGESGR